MTECEYRGKYRGKVEKNFDPLKLGRIQVSVPEVLGEGRESWAMPCVPYAGKGVGFFAIPPEKANIWVEFEGGNPDHPIWSGCFWGDGEVPAEPAEAGMKVIKTDVGTITLNDLKNSITIETNDEKSMKIEINTKGIEITNGQGASIKLEGPKVSINGSALEVE